MDDYKNLFEKEDIGRIKFINLVNRSKFILDRKIIFLEGKLINNLFIEEDVFFNINYNDNTLFLSNKLPNFDKVYNYFRDPNSFKTLKFSTRGLSESKINKFGLKKDKLYDIKINFLDTIKNDSIYTINIDILNTIYRYDYDNLIKKRTKNIMNNIEEYNKIMSGKDNINLNENDVSKMLSYLNALKIKNLL